MAAPPGQSAPEGQLRQGGRSLLLALYAALRSLKMYPVENATVQKSLDDLDAPPARCSRPRRSWRSGSRATSSSSTRTRLRVELDNYASFSHILAMLRAFEIGVLHIRSGMERREWQIFLSLLLEPQPAGADRRAARGAAGAAGCGQGDPPRGGARAAGGRQLRRRRDIRPSGSTRRVSPSPGT